MGKKSAIECESSQPPRDFLEKINFFKYRNEPYISGLPAFLKHTAPKETVNCVRLLESQQSRRCVSKNFFSKQIC